MLRAEIIGNLGADAEIKKLGNNSYISFNVAHSETRNGTETTQWVSVLRYDNGTGKLLPYLRKGTKVYAAGTLNVKTYTDRNNAVQVALNLNADIVQLCGAMPSQQQAQPSQQPQSYAQGESPYLQQEGDLPF